MIFIIFIGRHRIRSGFVCKVAPGLLKEPDELWIRQGIEPVFHLSNPWPRPGLAVFFIESLDIVFRGTVLKRTLHRTRAGLNPARPDCIGAGGREPRNVKPEQLQSFIIVRSALSLNKPTFFIPKITSYYWLIGNLFLRVIFSHFSWHD